MCVFVCVCCVCKDMYIHVRIYMYIMYKWLFRCSNLFVCEDVCLLFFVYALCFDDKILGLEEER